MKRKDKKLWNILRYSSLFLNSLFNGSFFITKILLWFILREIYGHEYLHHEDIMGIYWLHATFILLSVKANSKWLILNLKFCKIYKNLLKLKSLLSFFRPSLSWFLIHQLSLTESNLETTFLNFYCLTSILQGDQNI